MVQRADSGGRTNRYTVLLNALPGRIAPGMWHPAVDT